MASRPRNPVIMGLEGNRRQNRPFWTAGNRPSITPALSFVRRPAGAAPR